LDVNDTAVVNPPADADVAVLTEELEALAKKRSEMLVKLAAARAAARAGAAAKAEVKAHADLEPPRYSKLEGVDIWSPYKPLSIHDVDKAQGYVAPPKYPTVSLAESSSSM
jgi:hypothetical protein